VVVAIAIACAIGVSMLRDQPRSSTSHEIAAPVSVGTMQDVEPVPDQDQEHSTEATGTVARATRSSVTQRAGADLLRTSSPPRTRSAAPGVKLSQ
jgi:hypothetical protein